MPLETGKKARESVRCSFVWCSPCLWRGLVLCSSSQHPSGARGASRSSPQPHLFLFFLILSFSGKCLRLPTQSALYQLFPKANIKDLSYFTSSLTSSQENAWGRGLWDERLYFACICILYEVVLHN